MKMLIFILSLIISGIILPQSNFVRQITNYDYDSRNPSTLFQLSYMYHQGEFVFEIQEGNKINVGLIKYLQETDSFTVPVRITNNEAQNINPSVSTKFLDTHFALFQTNINGNWDIAISKEEEGIWTEPELLTTSGDDETNPVFTFGAEYFSLDTLWIIYEKANSIHLLSYREGVTADRIIFQADDTVTYSRATALGFSPVTFSTIRYSPGAQKIVYRNFDNVTGTLYPIYTIWDEGLPDYPEFFDSFGYYILTFTAEQQGGFRNIYYMYADQYYNPEVWVDNPAGDLSSLSLGPLYIITKSDMGTGSPASYRLNRNDSSFISLNNDENNPNPFIDTLYFTKVYDANLDVGLMGESIPYFIYYTIFEDSADGHINLFARKRNVSIDEVIKDNLKPEKYVLFQNYPNPFNPTTRLSIVIGHSSFVTIKVYDVLGKEVATVVNEQKSPGTYNINFNASGLSSGIYYYRLTSGNFSETKKMILLK